jgi:Lrp/AsnC family transcriptional regulator for asnA, asnC and gidA
MTFLDKLDFSILSHLQEDGRKSFTDIADALGVSVGTVRNRFSKLVADETLHVIGRANPHQVGFQTPANIHVSVQPPSFIERTAKAIAQFPEVSYVALVAGEFDLEVDVMCRDSNHLTELLTQRLHKLPGVSNTKTNVILKVLKYAQPNLKLLQGHYETL